MPGRLSLSLVNGERVIEVPSQRFGTYRVRSRLGEGGMAEVYLADAVDERGDEIHVALKLMKQGVSDEVFNNEADLMGLLSHPNLVRRLEVGEAFGRPYIAMEFLIGGDLAGLMRAHRQEMKDFPTPMGVYIVLEVLKGLAYFHQAKTRSGHPLLLVHGDVNPANVFFSDKGDVKLGDFGVAKSRKANLGPADNVTAGKLHYLSPEQTRGEPLTAASDLFAVGIMLHEMVVGYHPFQVKVPSVENVMTAIRAAKLSLPDYVDKPLAQILRRGLHPDVTSRYRSAGEFAGQLLHYALDAGQVPSPREVQHWLEGMLGLVS